ncbi:MAG: division/cell wall cluster transcriptional repressor MraZ [Elusimicrobiota bacterium]|nr:division/cell wall cluster transcriptional repressor MraZ [Endomicrobiia bacterium]MCX7910434.1 division/cell wall cluster transcriptional repressor MraZ [Endomicrobiia bacterium]MDW8165873.1 division/cell wall cluster transcriptional repressor MraZ [Elusimicrobiota bacterium]
MPKEDILTGISFHILDQKNRLFIPLKYRNKQKKFVMTYGLDNCVVIYSFKKWQEVIKKIENLSIKNKLYQRAFIRLFFAEAEIVEIDRQGRILIPKKFKDRFNLGNEIVLVGNKDKLEIWSKEEWFRYYKEVSKIINKIKTQIEI